MTGSAYQPEYDEHGVGFCSHELCPQYDGKRCRLTGFQPHGVCEPWGMDAARDKKAMDRIRKARLSLGYNSELDIVVCGEGQLGWYRIDSNGVPNGNTFNDPADAVLENRP